MLNHCLQPVSKQQLKSQLLCFCFSSLPMSLERQWTLKRWVRCTHRGAGREARGGVIRVWREEAWRLSLPVLFILNPDAFTCNFGVLWDGHCPGDPASQCRVG